MNISPIIDKLNIISSKLSKQEELTRDEQIIYDIILDISPDIDNILRESENINIQEGVIINPGYTDQAVQEITDQMIFYYDNILLNKSIIYE